MALIQCPECGKEISDKALTCPSCGCPIKAEEPKAVSEGWDCPNCGAHNTGNFCGKCGTKKPE